MWGGAGVLAVQSSRPAKNPKTPVQSDRVYDVRHQRRMTLTGRDPAWHVKPPAARPPRDSGCLYPGPHHPASHLPIPDFLVLKSGPDGVIMKTHGSRLVREGGHGPTRIDLPGGGACACLEAQHRDGIRDSAS